MRIDENPDLRVGKPSVISTPQNNIKINVLHILDCSGSMFWGNKYITAVEGINKELKTLPEVMGNFTFSLIEFGGRDRIEIIRNKSSDLNRVEPRLHDMGCTALSQAIVRGLGLFKLGVKDAKYLVKIFTDGGENNSPAGNTERAAKLIQQFNGAGHTITFVGTELDVQNAIWRYGIDESNTFVHNNTKEGIDKYIGETVSLNAVYAKRVRDGKDVTRSFYKK